MKRFLLFFIFGAALLTLTGASPDSSTKTGHKPVVSAGLPPVAFLARTIGGNRVVVHCMLPTGRSPHDYSPGAHDIRNAAGSRLFLTTGLTYEKAITRALSKQVKISDVSRNIKRIPFVTEEASSGPGRDKKEHEHHKHHEHETGSLDPHVWLSPSNARAMAAAIRDDLIKLDPAGAGVYRSNCARLDAELDAVGKKMLRQLAPYRGRAFYVYHPAFGYFARFTGLKQVGIELGGREAPPARLAEVIKSARAQKIRAVFVQPQFSPVCARALGKAINGEVIELDPLAENLPENFRKMSDALVRGFGKTGGPDGKNH